jgi:hypothetical protein
MVERLRGDAGRRPVVDPALAGGLRAWLEDGAAGVAPDDGTAVWIDGRVLGPATTGEDRVGPPAPGPLVRGAMVGALFRQLVVTGRIGDPVAEAMAALAAEGTSSTVLDSVHRLPAPERSIMDRVVRGQAETMAGQWSGLPAAWLPRVGERLRVPLAGGRVVLHGTADLVLGAPSDGRASICLVQVRSGDRRPVHRGERCLLALLETVRSGAAPFRSATYYPSAGEIDVEEVTEALLAATVEAVLVRMASGGRVGAVGAAAA